MITKQKSFNKSLVDENSQIIFLDEAHVGLLDADDWKILTQGGLTAHDRKYKKTTPAVIRCPMFITCQTELDFGEEHNAAMDARLRKFRFRSLGAPPAAGVQQFLKNNAMECIIWASSVARTPVDELPRPMPGSSAEQNDIDEEEKERIRSIKLDESESDQDVNEDAEQSFATQDSEVPASDDDDDSNANSTYLGTLEKTMEKISQLRKEQPRQSLRHRQLGMIGAGVRHFRDECDKLAELESERYLEETKTRWVALGMIKPEDADLLERVDGPYHPNIEKSREEYFAQKKEQEERQLVQKARSYYEDKWVLSKEKELQELQRQEDEATELDTKRALHYLIGVAIEALKLRFLREEVSGLQKYVLAERKRKASEMKWCSPEQAEQIGSVWGPLPFPSEAQQESARQSSGECASQIIPSQYNEDDDDELFITPVPSRHTSHLAFERTRLGSQSQRGKRRASPDRVQPANKKSGNTITNYFKSRA